MFSIGNCIKSVFSMKESEQLLKLRRREMVEMLQHYGIANRRVLDAFFEVPRHLFFDEDAKELAYNDAAYPIGFGQTISQPYTVAYMTSLLVERCPSGKVLEIGTGSGYQAAILDALGYSVFTVERIFELYERAEKLFSRLGLAIACRFGDGTLGWMDEAPFDGMVITAGAPKEPESLLEQLAGNGCIVIPIGSSYSQQMTVIRRSGNDFKKEVFQQFSFVPLVGKEGWSDTVF
jgi:protein-L-isoaspartate(D-aspartate) O-methyltransferase